MAEHQRHVSEDLAIVVCTRDRRPLLEQHLLPFLSAAAARGITVVVVDQSGGEETAELVRAVPGLTYLRSEPGLSRARNAGVAATSEPIIAFTDDDVTPPADWPDRVVEAFADSTIGMVLGRAVDTDGVEQPGSGSARYRHPLHPFGIGSGMNMAVRRAALLDAGAFDPNLGAGARFRAAEDTDMLYRVARAGWTISCRDDMTVVHQTWRDPAAELRLHFGYGMGAGAQCAKHAGSGDPNGWRILGREALRHLPTILRGLLTLDLHLLGLQVTFLAGLSVGAGRWVLTEHFDRLAIT